MHDVDAGFPRALLAMFVVAEVHPFNDGNGRLARLVMNSQLSANEEARIIIPTLYPLQKTNPVAALACTSSSDWYALYRSTHEWNCPCISIA